jgi:hypothetical protein
MGQMQVQYNPGTGNVTLNVKRGPQGFSCYYDQRGSDNLSTSGMARERVVEAVDTLITFSAHFMIGDDLEAWSQFYKWVLLGNSFSFYPNLSFTDHCICVVDDTQWILTWVAPRLYSIAFKWRMISNLLRPEVVMDRIYGVAS